MKGTMTMEWDEIFTEETCPECKGDGVGIDRRDYIEPCSGCYGRGKKVDQQKYCRYMDEYNYRSGLD